MAVEAVSFFSISTNEQILPIDTINSSVEPAAKQYDGHCPARLGIMPATNHKAKFAPHAGNSQRMAKVSVGFVHYLPDLIHREVEMLSRCEDSLLSRKSL